MRYGLKATVEGNLRIDADTSTESDGIRIELKSDEQGRLSTVVVSLEVQASRIGTVASAARARASGEDSADVAIDEKLHLIRFLQSIESDLAFSAQGHIDRIRWDDAFELTIPENADEEKLVPSRYLTMTFGRPQLKYPLTADAARTIAERSPQDDDLVAIKAFWREGTNEYREKRYVQAFYDFYFVIEGLFANGRSSKAEVLKAFAKSSEMSTVTDLALSRARANESYWPRLQDLLRTHSCGEDSSGAQKLLFALRGELHHFSTKKKGPQGTPLSQSKFETPAWFAKDFAFIAIARRDRQALYVHADGQWKPLS